MLIKLERIMSLNSMAPFSSEAIRQGGLVSFHIGVTQRVDLMMLHC